MFLHLKKHGLWWISYLLSSRCFFQGEARLSCSPTPWNSGICKYRNTEIQGYRNTGIQTELFTNSLECRNGNRDICKCLWISNIFVHSCGTGCVLQNVYEIIWVVKLTSFCDSLFLKFICTFPGAQILGLVPECFLCTTVALSEMMFWIL